MQHQQSLADQPLVDAEAAVEPLGAVVRGHEADGVVAEQLERLADLVVEIVVVVRDGRFQRMPGLVQPVLGVVVLPEPVVKPVDADLDELEVVPLDRRHEVADHLEVLARHVVDLVQQPALVVGAKAFDVHRIRTDEPLDVLLHRRRIGVVVRVGVGVRKHPTLMPLTLRGG